MSLSSRTSGEPYVSWTIAFMAFSSFVAPYTVKPSLPRAWPCQIPDGLGGPRRAVCPVPGAPSPRRLPLIPLRLDGFLRCRLHAGSLGSSSGRRVLHREEHHSRWFEEGLSELPISGGGGWHAQRPCTRASLAPVGRPGARRAARS